MGRRTAFPRPVRRWTPRVARAGFVAISVVYVTVGALAARAAIGWGGRPTDQPGAIRVMSRTPAGGLLAALIGLGLLGYAAWRFVQALADAEGKGRSWRALVTRSEFFVNGLLHLGLALAAFSIALGARAERSPSVRRWLLGLVDAPAAPWVMGLLGAIILGSGLYQFYKAISARFERDLETDRMSDGQRRWARRLGRVGMAARGVTFEIVGFFLVRAALHANPREARGVAGALRFLQAVEHGRVVLGLVALGLLAYGLYALVEARYRRVRTGPAG